MISTVNQPTLPGIALSDPDITEADLDAIRSAACSPSLTHGPRAEAFEEVFAKYIGRKHAVAVSNGMAGMVLALKAYGIGAGDEVISSAYSWRETAHALSQPSHRRSSGLHRHHLKGYLGQCRGGVGDLFVNDTVPGKKVFPGSEI